MSIALLQRLWLLFILIDVSIAGRLPAIRADCSHWSCVSTFVPDFFVRIFYIGSLCGAGHAPIIFSTGRGVMCCHKKSPRNVDCGENVWYTRAVPLCVVILWNRILWNRYVFGPGLKWDRRGLSAVLPCNLFSLHPKALCGCRNLLICVQWIAYDRLYPDVFRPKEFSFTRLHPLPPERYAEPSPCPVSLFIGCFICLFVSWISYLVFHLLPYAYLAMPPSTCVIRFAEFSHSSYVMPSTAFVSAPFATYSLSGPSVGERYGERREVPILSDKSTTSLCLFLRPK